MAVGLFRANRGTVKNVRRGPQRKIFVPESRHKATASSHVSDRPSSRARNPESDSDLHAATALAHHLHFAVRTWRHERRRSACSVSERPKSVSGGPGPLSKLAAALAQALRAALAPGGGCDRLHSSSRHASRESDQFLYACFARAPPARPAWVRKLSLCGCRASTLAAHHRAGKEPTVNERAPGACLHRHEEPDPAPTL
ncbi:hypothetical protein FGB62_189g037 [Gracilaria domingensis]|nr:hypothetical protein FGB62_189g037 [Gracilaria domingensis]